MTQTGDVVVRGQLDGWRQLASFASRSERQDTAFVPCKTIGLNEPHSKLNCQRTVNLIKQCTSGRPPQHAVCRAVAAADQPARLLDDCNEGIMRVGDHGACPISRQSMTGWRSGFSKHVAGINSISDNAAHGSDSPEKQPASMRNEAVEAAVNRTSGRCCSTASTLPTAAPALPADVQSHGESTSVCLQFGITAAHCRHRGTAWAAVAAVTASLLTCGY